MQFCRILQKSLQISGIYNTRINIINRKSSNTIMSKDLTLYGDYASPPVRFVMITAALLKTELKFHEIDLFKSEQKSDFFKKINPLQKVPALSVGNAVITDSHAIAIYLCRRSDHQELYPSDILLKAQVDEMLYFNATTLFPIDSEIYWDYFSGVWPPIETKLNKWNDAVDYLENKLKTNKYLTGDKMLLSDLCCHQTLISLGLTVPLLERHSRVKQWMETVEHNIIPSNTINERGLARFKNVINNVGPALAS